MRHWTKRLFAIAAPLLLTGCLWGPGKFNSGLTLKKDGTFVLDYRGEILTNNSEDGAAPHPLGRQLHWDVVSASTKIPEALIRL